MYLPFFYLTLSHVPNLIVLQSYKKKVYPTEDVHYLYIIFIVIQKQQPFTKKKSYPLKIRL